MANHTMQESLVVQGRGARNRFSASVAHPSPLLPVVVITTALILTVFEGAIRKWLLSGIMGPASYAMYLSKDFVFAFLLLCRPRYLPHGSAQSFRKYLNIGAVLIIAGGVVSSVQGISPVGAALTLRSMIILPIIAFFAARRLPTSTGSVIAWTAAGAGIINCGLSVLQSRLPPDHILNQYAVSEIQIVTLTTGVRAAGTFAYITGLGVMSTVAVWAGLSIMSLASSLRGKIVGWITIVAGIGCALASVSRAPLIVDALMVAGWASFARLGKQRVLAVVLTAATVIGVAAALGLLPTAERLSDALLQRTETTDDLFGERAFGQAEEAIAAVALAPFGDGLGFEQVGGNYFSTGQLAFGNFEGQFPRIIMDTTILGLIGYVIICIGALYALQLTKTGATPSARAFLLATQILLASIFYSSEVYNHTASSFGWIIFTVALAKMNLERSSNKTVNLRA
jgi:hypothetical protein